MGSVNIGGGRYRESLGTLQVSVATKLSHSIQMTTTRLWVSDGLPVD